MLQFFFQFQFFKAVYAEWKKKAEPDCWQAGEKEVKRDWPTWWKPFQDRSLEKYEHRKPAHV